MTKAARVFAARFLLALVALLALLPALGAESAWAAQRRVKIAVTSQWLREVASFICGDQASVRSLSVMDEAGRERLVARPARGEIIIAFDAADAARHRISEKNKNLRLLFDKVQVTEDELRGAFFDPAMLPFVAQEIMKAVSKIDPESYAYYQRRLAEFQSRIDSAIGVGRHMLAGSGAKLLGPITVGSNSKIGANSVVLRDVPEGATVAGVRARVVKLGGSPVRQQTAAEAYAAELEARLARLEDEIRALRAGQSGSPSYVYAPRFSSASRRGRTPRTSA